MIATTEAQTYSLRLRTMSIWVVDVWYNIIIIDLVF